MIYKIIKLMENSVEPEVIVGIDFGSSRIGYAFSFFQLDSINTCKFKGTKEKIKTLNEVILDDSNKILKFGFECEDYIKQGKINENCHYFKDIKMNLYIHNDVIQSINTNKTIHIRDLIGIILEYIKDDVFKKIREIRSSFDINKIKWILTVPAIWDERSKYIMINACKNAGIIGERLYNNLFDFALEPEAASYYCVNEQSIESWIFYDSYIICDLGGGTGDIVTHQRVNDNNIEKIVEKYPPQGGPYGSNEINRDFIEEVIKVLFGNDIYDKLIEKVNSKEENKRVFYRNYLEFFNNIDYFKESISEENENDLFMINCSCFNGIVEEDIDEIVNKYNNKCKKGWNIEVVDKDQFMLEFPYKIIYDLFKKRTDDISKILNNIISQVENVKNILYVGGFCNNEYIVNMIKKNITQKNINHIKPNNPDNAVLKGAIYYGLDPKRIKSRKARYTFGMHAYLDWDDKYNNGGNKIYDINMDCYRCENAFYHFISMNDDIPFENYVSKPLRVMKSNDELSGGDIRIFKSTKENPLFIDEEGVELIGEFKFEIKGNYEGTIFYVSIYFGGTFIRAIATHNESNTKTEMEYNIEEKE